VWVAGTPYEVVGMSRTTSTRRCRTSSGRPLPPRAEDQRGYVAANHVNEKAGGRDRRPVYVQTNESEPVLNRRLVRDRLHVLFLAAAQPLDLNRRLLFQHLLPIETLHLLVMAQFLR
jgi:hypothetical protein